MSNAHEPASLRIMIILGSESEVIKMAPVVRVLQTRSEACTVRVCAATRHRDMIDQVLDVFGIAPDIEINLIQPDQGPSALAARVLTEMDVVLKIENPDWVLVQGDAINVTMIALAAQHRQARVGHVEAGVRTADWRNRFPAEMNRVLTDHMSDLCFAPTLAESQNLRNEGIADARIRVTGNTLIDALFDVVQDSRPVSLEHLLNNLIDDRKWLLVTLNHRESFDQPLTEICAALQRIAVEREHQTHIIYSVNRDSSIWEPVHEGLSDLSNVALLPSVDYRTLVHLLKHCYLVLTDSDDLQEQAPSLHKPVLILRQTTGRPEAVAVGAARVVGTDPNRIVTETYRLLDDDLEYERMAQAPNPFGDGHAAQRIAAALLEFA